MKNPDIRNGNISLQTYIDLRQALLSYANTQSLSQLIKDVTKATQGKEYKVVSFSSKEVLLHVKSVVEDMNYWAEIEQKTLQTSLSSEERQAGAEDLANKIGWLGVVVSLAKDFATRPEVILEKWTWKEVYSVLYVEHCKAEYERRLNKIIFKKK